MMENLDRLAEEIDEGLRAFDQSLKVEPSEAVVYRVQAAVRHEINEAWLRQQPTPLPTAKSLRRVREALHGELQRSAGGIYAESANARRPMRPFLSSPALASLAAAAMITLCLGVVHRAGTLKPPAILASSYVQAGLDSFDDAVRKVMTEDSQTDPQTAAILSDLDRLEQGISEWQPVKDSPAQELDDTVKEIDQLLSQPESGKDMSRAYPVPRGAFG